MIEQTAGISVRELVRSYQGLNGRSRTALRGISFQAPYGQVTGLLGPNGAGKTTCVKVLTTLLTPTFGHAFVAGMDVVSQPRKAQMLTGVSFGGDNGLYGRLSALDNLRFFGTMYGLHGRTLRGRALDLLAKVGLEDRARDRVETFSRGMRQRLHIARALIHDPPVLLLDEPSSGMDPENARELRHLVTALADEGKAILLTSHNMAETEAICHQILILIDGQIARSATPISLREDAARSLGAVVEVRFRDLPPDMERAFDGFPGLLESTQQGLSLRMRCTDGAAGAAFLFSRFGDNVGALQVTAPTLEDAYLAVVK